MSGIHNALVVLHGLDRAAAVKLVARLPDRIVERLGHELVEFDVSAISSDQIDAAILAMIRQIGEAPESGASVSGGTQLLTTQECVVLASCVAREKPEIAAILLHRFPMPVTTRVLLVMARTERQTILARYRDQHEVPHDFESRVLLGFLEAIPTRPFPALGQRLRDAMIEPDDPGLPIGTSSARTR